MTDPTGTPQETMRQLLRRGTVVPVVTVESAEDGVEVARALLAGGVTTIEVTLRSAAALDAIRAIRSEVPEIAVGAGTLLDASMVEAALEAGAQFGVSPGATPSLLAAARERRLPFLPGVATVSEALSAREQGFVCLKLFPASVVGIGFPPAVAPVLPGVVFCPTGGITEADAARWLAHPNVIAVGGSWLVPRPALAAKAWGAIRDLAARAAAIR